MAISLTSIGVKVGFAFSNTATNSPESLTYTRIPQVKSIPEMNPSPDTLETTSFDNLEFKTYVAGLKDLGGVIDFNANLTQELYNQWEGVGGIMATWETTKAAGGEMYLCINIPNLSDSCYLSVEPSHIGLPAAEVNSVLETTLHFTPVGEPVWADDPAGDETMVDTTVTTYNVTFTGYVSDGVDISVLKNNALVKEFITEDTSTIIKLPNGDYTAIAKKSGKTTQVKDFTVDSATETVTFSTFA